MDFLPDSSTLSFWLTQYGSFYLFALLALGIVIFPIPEETMMLMAGVLIRKGTLSPLSTLAAACAGSICGISISYLLGRSIGLFFIIKYGKWVGLTNKRWQKFHIWSERFGKWPLFFGYFVPGVRHFTGLFAGATKLNFKRFAMFAYSGAIVWVSCFLGIGYFFGFLSFSIYEKIEFTLDNALLILLVLLVLLLVSFIIYRVRKK